MQEEKKNLYYSRICAVGLSVIECTLPADHLLRAPRSSSSLFPPKPTAKPNQQPLEDQLTFFLILYLFILFGSALSLLRMVFLRTLTLRHLRANGIREHFWVIGKVSPDFRFVRGNSSLMLIAKWFGKNKIPFLDGIAVNRKCIQKISSNVLRIHSLHW